MKGHVTESRDKWEVPHIRHPTPQFLCQLQVFNWYIPASFQDLSLVSVRQSMGPQRGYWRAAPRRLTFGTRRANGLVNDRPRIRWQTRWDETTKLRTRHWISARNREVGGLLHFANWQFGYQKRRLLISQLVREDEDKLKAVTSSITFYP